MPWNLPPCLPYPIDLAMIVEESLEDTREIAGGICPPPSHPKNKESCKHSRHNGNYGQSQIGGILTFKIVMAIYSVVQGVQSYISTDTHTLLGNATRVRRFRDLIASSTSGEAAMEPGMERNMSTMQRTPVTENRYHVVPRVIQYCLHNRNDTEPLDVEMAQM